MFDKLFSGRLPEEMRPGSGERSPSDDSVLFRTRAVDFPKYVAWRRCEQEKSNLIRRLTHLSRQYIEEGAPPSLATFAHDGNGHVVNAMGRPERWQFDVILEALHHWGLIRGVALDIGANLGLQSLLFAGAYDYVIAFEPHPNTYQLLKYNLENNVSNGRALHLALSTSNGTATLSSTRSAHSGSFGLRDGNDQGNSFTVPTARLDDVDLPSGQQIGLMKIDVEGAELQVLKGAERVIAEHRPVIIMEDWQSRKGNPSYAVELLRGHGYQTILEPTFHPRRSAGRRFRRLIQIRNALRIWRQGHAFALARCDFQ